MSLGKVFGSTKGNRSFLLPVLLIAAMGLGLYAMGGLPTDVSSTSEEQLEATQPASTAESQDYLIQDYDSLQAPVAVQSDNWWGDSIDVFVKLVIVLAVLYLALRGLRYLNNKSRASTNANSPVKVLYTTSLAQHQNLYLVEVGNKVLLLGGTSNNLGLLAEVVDPEALVELHANTSSNPAGSVFSSYLDKLLKSSKPVVSPVAPAPTVGSLGRVMEDFRQNLSRTRAEIEQAVR